MTFIGAAIDTGASTTRAKHRLSRGTPKENWERARPNPRLLHFIQWINIEVFSEPGALKAEEKPMPCGPTG